MSVEIRDASDVKFSIKLRKATEEAVLLGTKVAVVLLFVAFSLGLILNDYAVVRGNALRGAQAFEFIVQSQQAQQQKQSAPAAPVPPDHGGSK